jgi:hypothetical protein
VNLFFRFFDLLQKKPEYIAKSAISDPLTLLPNRHAGIESGADDEPTFADIFHDPSICKVFPTASANFGLIYASKRS